MKLATLTAMALALTATGAIAQSDMSTDTDKTASMTDSDTASGMHAELIRTRDITGGSVYTINAANDEGWDPDMMHDSVVSDWNEIGTIEDLVLSREGQLIGIVAEIGGVLDLGDKHVMISVEDLNLVAVDDTTYTYVTRMSEEELEEMQGVDEGFWN